MAVKAPPADSWPGSFSKKFDALTTLLRDAKDDEDDHDGESTLLADSLGRQVADIATVLDANDPDALVGAINDQTAAFTKSANWIADSQKAAAAIIAGAINNHVDAGSGSPAASLNGRLDDNAALLMALSIGPHGEFAENDYGRWFTPRFKNVFDLASHTPDQFIRKMSTKREGEPPLVATLVPDGLKGFLELVRQLVKFYQVNS